MFTFTVKPDDAEPYEVTATSRDVVRWEAKGGGRSLGRLSDNPSMKALTELAHLAAMRAGRFHAPFDQFAEQVDVEVQKSDELDDNEVGSGPTRPGH